MGSNQNRSGDRKAAREWGSKSRKEEAARKSRAFEERVIEDSIESNIVDRGLEIGIDTNVDMLAEIGMHPSPPKKRRRKDTRRWCRGKEGREHQEFLMESRSTRWFSFDKYRCEVCGKERTEWKR
jgi:hypothetical protein